MNWWIILVSVAVISVIYCEIVADYFVLFQCSWPNLNNTTTGKNGQVRAMIIADTHLLGPYRGHWLDKLYREWHMSRCFQASMELLQPDVVFVLGDLFDEGDWVYNSQFKEYVNRFQRLFKTPTHTRIISAVGNHDVGFHYKMNPNFINRFQTNFNNTGAEMYTIRGVHFVFINSMSMERDGCEFCEKTVNDLQIISKKLKCLRSGNCKDKTVLNEHIHYSPPILLQHFPTYRDSDLDCIDHDSPTIEKYRVNHDVLSKSSTHFLGSLLKPRVSFAGHSHHYCLSRNLWGVEEYTVASFSWRNKINPSFLLAIFANDDYTVKKCDMLAQEDVRDVYVLSVLTIFFFMTLKLFQKFTGFFFRKLKV